MYTINYYNTDTYITYHVIMKHFNAQTCCFHVYLHVYNQHSVHSVKKYLS